MGNLLPLRAGAIKSTAPFVIHGQCFRSTVHQDVDAANALARVADLSMVGFTGQSMLAHR